MNYTPEELAVINKYIATQASWIKDSIAKSLDVPVISGYGCNQDACGSPLQEDANGNLYCPIHAYETGRVEREEDEENESIT